MTEPQAQRTTDWRDFEAADALTAETVHVWCLDLALEAPRLERYRGLLDSAEQARAERYRVARDRARFIVTRGALRRLIGFYSDTAPASITLSQNLHGKPRLAAAPEGLRFNVSHSDRCALVAIASDFDVGIDVERQRPLNDLSALAERFFSAEEFRSLAALPIALKRRGFFATWTRKEAYIKGLGCGLSRPLDSFTVAVDPMAPPKILSDRDDPSEASCWHLEELFPGPDLSACLAVRAPTGRFRLRTFRYESVARHLDAD